MQASYVLFEIKPESRMKQPTFGDASTFTAKPNTLFWPTTTRCCTAATTMFSHRFTLFKSLDYIMKLKGVPMLDVSLKDFIWKGYPVSTNLNCQSLKSDSPCPKHNVWWVFCQPRLCTSRWTQSFAWVVSGLQETFQRHTAGWMVNAIEISPILPKNPKSCGKR